MLRRSYLQSAVSVLGVGALFGRADNRQPEWWSKPHGWDELAPEDQKNILQFIKRLQQQGAETRELRHDLRTLVGLANLKVDGRLSRADLGTFGEVATRPNRVLPQFLIFTGAEAPRCPKCGTTDYEPAENYPGQMRCRKCLFRYSEKELASMVSPGGKFP